VLNVGSRVEGVTMMSVQQAVAIARNILCSGVICPDRNVPLEGLEALLREHVTRFGGGAYSRDRSLRCHCPAALEDPYHQDYVSVMSDEMLDDHLQDEHGWVNSNVLTAFCR
jgi:hypothetical protein